MLLDLRDPDFGNSFKFVPNTRIHRTMDNDLRTLQGNAPTWEGFTCHFTALNQEQIDTFKAWIYATFGTIVKFIDFEGRTWTGIVVSQSIPIFNGIGQCNYQTEFEFEGQVSG